MAGELVLEKRAMGNQVEVLDHEGKAQGAVELPEELFAAKVSEYAVYRAVVTYEANQRQGTAAVRSRSEVARTGKKHHRQKGTGWARRGSLRSPLVRGGGVAFGPQPRSYELRMTKSLKRLAFRSALTLKAQQGAVHVVEDMEPETPSTKAFVKAMRAWGLGETAGGVLLVTAGPTPMLEKSCRNVRGVTVEPVGCLGTYAVVAAERVVFTRSAIAELVRRCAVATEEPRSGSE